MTATPATPQDHKSKTFSFEFGGKTFTIPAFASLPMGALRKARKTDDDLDKMFIILEMTLDEGSPELDAIDKMDGETLDGFLKEWTQGAPLGESGSSES